MRTKLLLILIVFTVLTQLCTVSAFAVTNGEKIKGSILQEQCTTWNAPPEGQGSVIPVPGRVQTRINVASGPTRFSPSSSAGFDRHVVPGHFDRALGNNRSVFTVSQNELKSILQRPDVVSSPAVGIDSGRQFVRTVDVGQTIGNTSLNHGGRATSWIQIYTDRAGNLISAFPVPGR